MARRWRGDGAAMAQRWRSRDTHVDANGTLQRRATPPSTAKHIYGIRNANCFRMPFNTNWIKYFFIGQHLNAAGAFDSAKNHKRKRRKRQSVTAKRKMSQTPKFV